MRLMVTGAASAETIAALTELVRSREVRRRTDRTLSFHYEETGSAAVRAEVDRLCLECRLDHCFDEQDMNLDSIRLVAMDMDSTLITIECIDELAARIGVGDEVARITEAAMRGEIKDFAASLIARVALLKGAPEQILDDVYRDRLRLTEGAEAFLAGVRRRGIETVLVSGGFTYFTARLQQRLQIDHALANRLDTAAGRLTGTVSPPIVDGAAKAHYVQTIADRSHATRPSLLVIGDGANDLPMMRLAGTSVAFHAKPAVRASATHSIDFAGLDVLLDWMTDDPRAGPGTELAS